MIPDDACLDPNPGPSPGHLSVFSSYSTSDSSNQLIDKSFWVEVSVLKQRKHMCVG